jgi:hypothetical protein
MKIILQHYGKQLVSDRSVVFSYNTTDCHDITETLLKVELSTLTPNPPENHVLFSYFNGDSNYQH